MRNRLLLLGATLAAFGASLFSGFHFDDYAIFSDRAITTGASAAQFLALRRGPLGAEPLATLSFWVSYHLAGHNAWVYHLVSLLLTLVAVLLAYECLLRLLPSSAALIGAAIFALHPIQAESVNYIWGRNVLIAATLCLAALLAWLEKKRWLSVPLFALALLADEHCAAFALVPWLVDRRDEKRGGRWETLVMAVLAVAALARAAYASWLFPPPMAFGKFAISQGRVMYRYFLLVLFPYGFNVDPDIAVPKLLLGELFWLTIASAYIWGWKLRKSDWGRWLFAGLLLLLPAASLLPAADLAADRRMFLPMFAFAAAAAVLLSKVKTSALAACIAVVLGLLSVSRTYVWMNDKRLWQEAVKRSPDKVRPKVQLSRYLPAAEALHMLQMVEITAPNDPSVQSEMGRILLSEKQVEPAILHFGRALTIEPGNPKHFNDRGVALAYFGEYALSRADFKRALVIDPQFAEASENLAKLPPEQ
jgi:protein O-mannosyl-transferase